VAQAQLIKPLVYGRSEILPQSQLVEVLMFLRSVTSARPTTVQGIHVDEAVACSQSSSQRSNPCRSRCFCCLYHPLCYLHLPRVYIVSFLHSLNRQSLPHLLLICIRSTAPHPHGEALVVPEHHQTPNGSYHSSHETSFDYFENI
jgi:hypothetical protein